MDEQLPGERPATRYLERRVAEKGIRPRFAASLIAGAWLVAIVVFGVVEHFVDRENFDNVWEGMWWATQTVTTVGYGDSVPDNTVGQVIAVILMVGGLSLFAVVTATITSAFVARAQDQIDSEGANRHTALTERLESLGSELEAVRAQLERLDPPRGGPG